MRLLFLPRFVASPAELATAIRAAADRPPAPGAAMPLFVYEGPDAHAPLPPGRNAE